MFLKEFKNDTVKENFIKLIGIIINNYKNKEYLLYSLILESELNIEFKNLEVEIEDILAFEDDEDEFNKEIQNLIKDADFKFYIDFIMAVFEYPTHLTLKIKNILEQELGLNESIVNLCNTWAINTATHVTNVRYIINY